MSNNITVTLPLTEYNDLLKKIEKLEKDYYELRTSIRDKARAEPLYTLVENEQAL